MLMAAQDLLKQSHVRIENDSRTSLRHYCGVQATGHRRRRRDHSADPRRTACHDISSEKSETLSALDRPNSYVGKTVPRPNLDG